MFWIFNNILTRLYRTFSIFYFIIFHSNSFIYKKYHQIDDDFLKNYNDVLASNLALPLEKLNHLKEYLTDKEYSTLNNFKKKLDSRNWKSDKIENYYKTSIVIGARVDSNKNIVGGVELTLDDKASIIDYLVSNNIPVNKRTVSEMQKRYVMDMKDVNKKKLC